MKNIAGFLFISPWLIGFIGFVIGPMIASFYLSFTSYDMLTSAKWVGLKNYISMFTDDPRFWKALIVTLKFVVIAVPLKLAFALFVAMLFNTSHKGQGLYSTIYYVPSILGGSVAVAVMWRLLFGRDGAVNAMLEGVGLGIITTDWINSPDYALSVIILLIVWQFGAPMLIFLAGLKNIPKELYEAAAVDGAGFISRFIKITIPMLTPVIFFNLVMQTIHGFMIFTQGYLITGGGPLDETLFFSLYLYESAFEYFKMGYASAMAWIMLLIIAFFTAVIFKTSKSWVYYESEGGR
ncbi:carbohydrate ABC transporter permease [Aquibacillus albus]|nr:sugar ABC transporter permease [Aquibacillus albus]